MHTLSFFFFSFPCLGSGTSLLDDWPDCRRRCVSPCTPVCSEISSMQFYVATDEATKGDISVDFNLKLLVYVSIILCKTVWSCSQANAYKDAINYKWMTLCLKPMYGYFFRGLMKRYVFLLSSKAFLAQSIKTWFCPKVYCSQMKILIVVVVPGKFERCEYFSKLNTLKLKETKF